MIHWQLRLLGSFELAQAGEPADGSRPEENIRLEKGFRSQNERALLAYLAVEAGRPNSRDALAGLLWPEMPADTAHNNLRVTLHRLRQVLGEPGAADPFLDVSRDTIQLKQTRQLWLDVSAFLGYFARADRHPHEKLATCPECLAGYAEAAALYRGEFLQGVNPADSLPFAEWALLKREHLHRQAMHALYLLAAYHQRRGELDQALGYARRQLELEPWREEAHCQVMTILALRGERSAALRQYERCRQVLGEELGVDPAEETRMLYERILASRDKRPPNLPQQLTPFLGRKTELNQVNEFLADPDCRLLTLLGPGGIGKSRLAFQAAEAQVYANLQGVFLIQLAGVTTQGNELRTIAGALDFQLRPTGDPKTQLLDYLRAKEMLLVLDNYEQLLGPGNTSAVSLLEELLANAPDVRLLITSRQRLNLRQERVIVLQGLPFPEDVLDPQTEKYAAVQLFLQSARRIGLGFELLWEDEPAIARICQLLGGVPLAIELAAAWTRMMSPEQIVQEIESNLDFLASSYPDLPERQRSLRATFEYSFNLLTPAEQQALCRLSIFPAGFERSAAELVADASLAVLASLRDRSLVEQVSFKKRESHPRYRLHELIRQFCSEKLAMEPAEVERTKDRHRSFYMRFLNERNPQVMGGRTSYQAVREVGSEIENVRLALEQAIAEGHLNELGHSLNILMFFSEIHGLFAEAERIFGQISRCMQAGIHTGAAAGAESWNFLGRALMYHGWYCMHLARYDQAIELTQQGLALCRQSGDWEGYGLGLNSLGLIATDQGKYPQAETYLQEAIDVCEAHGFPWSQAAATTNLGYLALLDGDLSHGVELFQQSKNLHTQLNDQWGLAGVFEFLGDGALREGNLAQAEQYFRHAHEIRQKLGQRWRVALSLKRLGEVAYCRQQYAEAKQDYAESLALLRDFGERLHIAATLVQYAEACAALEENIEARESLLSSFQLAREIGAEGTILKALLGFAELVAGEGEKERAVEILAAIQEHPSLGHSDQVKANKLLAELRLCLPPRKIETSLEKGKKKNLDDLQKEIFLSGRSVYVVKM